MSFFHFRTSSQNIPPSPPSTFSIKFQDNGSGLPHQNKEFKMAILPTHTRFQNPPVYRSGLRLREKYVLMLIFVAFLLMCFGAFFYVPELKDRTYLDDAYRRFVGAGGEIFPLKPPKTPIVKLPGKNKFIIICFQDFLSL